MSDRRHSNSLMSVIVRWPVFAAAAVLSAALLLWPGIGPDARHEACSLVPWKNIGGCGAGGSGGLGGGNIKWIGRGVSGGLLDVQSITSVEIGQTRRNFASMQRLSFKPTFSSSIALSIPVLSKTAQFQPQTNLPSRTEVTGGVGDLLLDFSRTFGSIGQYAFMATLTLPTGQYDIKRGEETNQQYLSNILQLGGGVYAASLGLSYSRDFDRGILIADFLATHPFVINVSGTNNFNDEASGGWGYDTDLMSGKEKQRFVYHFKPYGENDLDTRRHRFTEQCTTAISAIPGMCNHTRSRHQYRCRRTGFRTTRHRSMIRFPIRITGPGAARCSMALNFRTRSGRCTSCLPNRSTTGPRRRRMTGIRWERSRR
jgi:hypothetical protein